METVFQEEITLQPVQADASGQAKLSTILYLIQEISGRHADTLGTSWDALQCKKLFWAIIRHRVQINRLPEAGEPITLQTHPMPTSRVAYPRATVAYDAQGAVLFRSHALWVLMDTENRAMVLPGKSGVAVCGALLGDELESPISLSPKELSRQLSRVVLSEDLDRNGHMNNCRYLDWIDELIEDTFRGAHPVREISLCYLAEALLQQQIDLQWELTDGPVLTVEAHRTQTPVLPKKDRIFAARLVFD